MEAGMTNAVLCSMTLQKATQAAKAGKPSVTLEFTARIDAALMSGLPQEVCAMYARMLEADLSGTWAPSEKIRAREFAVFVDGAAEFEPEHGAELERVRLTREEEKGERVTRLSFAVRLEGDDARAAARWAAKHGCKGVELRLKDSERTNADERGGAG